MDDIMQERLIAKRHEWTQFEETIRKSRFDTEEHVKAVQDKVDLTFNEKVRLVKEGENGEAERINHEFDVMNGKIIKETRKIEEGIRKKTEEIQAMNQELRRNDDKISKNNEKRHKMLLKLRQDSELRRAPVEQMRQDCGEELETIMDVIKPRIAELERLARDAGRVLKEVQQKLDALGRQCRPKVKDAIMERAVTDALKMSFDMDALERIRQRVSRVKFVRTIGYSSYDGRIDVDGYNGHWRLMDEINVMDRMKYPTIVGCVGSSKVLVTDWEVGSMHTYLLDTNTKRIDPVIKDGGQTCVVSSASLPDGRIVCGKRRTGCKAIALGQSLIGCISVYDKHWKLVNDFVIPRNNTLDDTWVYVAVDPEGLIIAAEWGQGNVYFINPDDGSIKRRITFSDLVRGVVLSGLILAAFSSNHCTVLKFKRGGSYKEIPFVNNIRSACIDPLTDALYVMTSGKEYKKCGIEYATTKSGSKRKRVATMCLSTRLVSDNDRLTHLEMSQVIMTPSGKIIVSDGNSIQIIRKDWYSMV
ncbi:uncharacterized protein LOC121417639 [Lytechinus variegatus]|uniref:uncharacterized protein LOC121417639 n=1 Tax=Lytechinus variegatus TaxID=7654 RepID=UPI001BB20434|nr:uncharacterized protein LOC121417639 [Lytechinus variegatus]